MAHSTLHQILFAMCELAFCFSTSMILEKVVKQNLICGSNSNSMFQATGLKRDRNYYSIHSNLLWYDIISHMLSKGHRVMRKKAKYNPI